MKKQIVKKKDSKRSKKAIKAQGMKSLLNYVEGKLNLKGHELAKILEINTTQQYYEMKKRPLSKRLVLLCKIHDLGISWQEIGERLEKDFKLN